jgi:hypothetical protein
MIETTNTSAVWHAYLQSPLILDPDGWDRKNYDYSFFEESITKEEYLKRLSKSTVMIVCPKRK